MIGSLGDIVFEVSSESIKTFRDMQLSQSAKYAVHDIHNKKSLLEFTGFAPSTLSLKITFSAALGIIPKDELNALREILKNHEAVTFVLDGEPQGDGKWVLESLNETHSVIDNQGRLILCDVSISLKEYVESGSI